MWHNLEIAHAQVRLLTNCIVSELYFDKSIEEASSIYETTSEDIRQRCSPQDAATFGWLAEKRRLEREKIALAEKVQSQVNVLYALGSKNESCECIRKQECSNLNLKRPLLLRKLRDCMRVKRR